MVITALLQEEGSPDPTTELGLITSTHVEKLIKELLGSKLLTNADPRSKLSEIFIKVRSLERKWQRRFKTLYSDIDKIRTEEMMRCGILQGLTFAPMEDKEHTWIVNSPRCPDVAGSLDLNPGDWWPNLHCAYRDGAVGPGSPSGMINC